MRFRLNFRMKNWISSQFLLNKIFLGIYPFHRSFKFISIKSFGFILLLWNLKVQNQTIYLNIQLFRPIKMAIASFTTYTYKRVCRIYMNCLENDDKSTTYMSPVPARGQHSQCLWSPRVLSSSLDRGDYHPFPAFFNTCPKYGLFLNDILVLYFLNFTSIELHWMHFSVACCFHSVLHLWHNSSRCI